MPTDLEIRQAKAAEADYKLSDLGGLYLLVTTAGGRSWRLKYHFGGKEKRLTFGRHLDVTLAEARGGKAAPARGSRSGRRGVETAAHLQAANSRTVQMRPLFG
jgi:hypothetical protein